MGRGEDDEVPSCSAPGCATDAALLEEDSGFAQHITCRTSVLTLIVALLRFSVVQPLFPVNAPFASIMATEQITSTIDDSLGPLLIGTQSISTDDRRAVLTRSIEVIMASW